MKIIRILLILILTGGTIFAWYTVFGDFDRFFSAGGEISAFSGCKYPNPLATPCFYGAIAFLIALVWSVNNYFLPAEKQLRSQKHLTWLLLAGTLFAWGNFSYALYKFYKPRTGPFLSCSGTLAAHPINTPCFYGATIYLAALIISIYAYKASSAKSFR